MHAPIYILRFIGIYAHIININDSCPKVKVLISRGCTFHMTTQQRRPHQLAFLNGVFVALSFVKSAICS